MENIQEHRCVQEIIFKKWIVYCYELKTNDEKSVKNKHDENKSRLRN